MKKPWYKDPTKVTLIGIGVGVIAIIVMIVLQILDWTIFSRIIESLKIMF